MLKRLIDWLLARIAPDTDEYFERFVTPQIARARKLGIPAAELDQMWETALNLAGPYHPPGMILRNLIDLWVEEHHAA